MSATIEAMKASLNRIQEAAAHSAFGKSAEAQAILFCKAEDLSIAIAVQTEMEYRDRSGAEGHLNCPGC